MRLGPLLLACVFFTAYLTLRARASFNILRAAYPDERFRFRDLGRLLRRLRLQRRVPARGGDVVRLFLTRRRSRTRATRRWRASFFVEPIFDVAMGSLILLFAFTQGVFPKPPDFAKLNAFDLSYLAGHPRFTLFLMTALAVGTLVALRAPVSARMKAFWQRVKQGFTILRDRRRYLREVFAVQLAGWVFRFAAFWMLLEAFRVGGSVKNVLLVLGVNAVAAAVPFTPQGAGVAQALLVKVFAGTARGVHRGGLLGGPADRDRRAHVRDRLRGARVHLPRAQLQGGDPLGREHAAAEGARADARARPSEV